MLLPLICVALAATVLLSGVPVSAAWFDAWQAPASTQQPSAQVVDIGMEALPGSGDYAYKNTADGFELLYANDAQTGLAMDGAFTLSAANAAAGAIALPAETAQSANGAGRLMYPQAFGGGTSVAYTNTVAGCVESIVLEENAGIHQFDFIFRSETHTPVLSTSGASIDIVPNDGQGIAQYRIAELSVTEAGLSAAPAAETTTPAQTQTIGAAEQMTVPATNAAAQTTQPFIHAASNATFALQEQPDGSYILSILVSEAFLSDPQTAFPVTVDSAILLAAPAGAASITAGTYYIRNVGTGQYLDVVNNQTANNSDVYHWAFTGKTNQQWKITHLQNNQYRLEPVHALGKSLSIGSSLDANGIRATIWANNAAGTTHYQSQNWSFVPYGTGSYRMHPGCSSTRVLGGWANAYADLYTIDPNNPNSQRWVLERVNYGAAWSFNAKYNGNRFGSNCLAYALGKN
jgi:hypothetical protein